MMGSPENRFDVNRGEELMTSEHERQSVERWVNFISNVCYFVFGMIAFSVLFLAVILFVAWLSKPSWVDELFTNHLTMLLFFSAIAGGLIGVVFKNKLTRYFFGGGGALD